MPSTSPGSSNRTSLPLRELLSFTRDGEWGKGEPAEDHSPALVIRGTDFQAVRNGDLSSLPTRYIRRAVLERKQLQPDDVLLETAGGSKGRPTGRSLLVKASTLERANLPVVCASFSRFLRPDRSLVEPAYLYWWLQYLYETGKMDRHQVQHTGVARFQYTRFAESSCPPLPPREAQHRIAHILGTLDDKIELNRRMNRTLEAIARAIFKSWFIDFDPVHATAEGKEPVGMDPETAALFPNSFQDSPLGKIPKGWEVSRIGEQFDVTMGQSPPGSTYNEDGEGLPFYQGRKDFGFRYPQKRVYCREPHRIAEAGDALVTVRAPVGDVNMAPEEVCIGRGVAAVRHKSGSRSFTYYAVLSLRERFAQYEAEGTVFGSIGKTQLLGLQSLAPPGQVVGRFEQFAFPIDEWIERSRKGNSSLAVLREALLPELLSGELLLHALVRGKEGSGSEN